MSKAILMLANGEVFQGKAFGHTGETAGEVVFNTSMTGYQEILTDPSYRGQIVTMTYTQIGNYGVNTDDVESEAPQVAGFIVREYSKTYSNWRATGSLGDYLDTHKIVGIEGIDTRKLTRILRQTGAMNGVLSSVDFDLSSLKAKIAKIPNMVGLDLAKEVTIDKPLKWGKVYPGGWNVIAVHAGIKTNILRILNAKGCNITLVPAAMTAEEMSALHPDGIFVSNGPGDPEPVTYAIDALRKMIGKVPIFGICLGHELLALAVGGKCFKLKFGHRGANHPVKDLRTGKVEIASHNHGFAVDPDSLPEDMEISHINLNDQTVAGIRHKKYPAFSVQYHPEASPGPHDSHYLFDEFIEDMRKWKTGKQ
ncbi:MAG: carbamoyl phosphate synthase small subunit [Spirochaetes bacterium GWF1_51_8]|nr:MAG: carbamoyl phosphate synthase small subunit [Spirochaetes bacterium GWF1_51_8]